jgi:RNA polymerase sigma-70 factor, ECF subfamily
LEDRLPFEPESSFDIADMFSEYEARLHRYAYHLTKDDHAAADLVQETFIKAMTHIWQLRSMNLHQRQAWLYKVLKNLFLDRQRAHQRERALFQRLDDLTQATFEPGEKLSLEGAMDRIPETYREVLHLRYVQEMNSTEIGTHLDLPPATVRSRLHMAMKWLRTHQSWFT